MCLQLLVTFKSLGVKIRVLISALISVIVYLKKTHTGHRETHFSNIVLDVH